MALELVLETLTVRVLEEPWPKRTMHGDGVSDDRLREGTGNQRHRHETLVQESNPTRNNIIQRTTFT